MTPDPLADDVIDRGEHALARLSAMREADPPTTGGRVLSYVYDSGLAGLDDLALRAARLAHGVNGLDPTVFASVAGIHGGIVDRVRGILRGGDGVYGSVTSGGTESCVLACLAAREVRGRTAGDGGRIVAPVTVHAAFRKAAHLLGLEFVGVEVDPDTGRVRAEELLAAVDSDTVLVVCSAPSYPTGVVDPVAEVAEGLDSRHDRQIGLHVDACLGGLVLPFWPDAQAVEPWDFRVDRVTSISADLHKYGFAPKGTSVLLSRGRARHRAAWFATIDWPGYPVVNPTLAGSKPLEPAAAAWAVSEALGDDGQRELVARSARATDSLVECLSGIEGLCVLERDPGPLIAVAADRDVPDGRRIHPHLWADACARRGIAVQSQPAFSQVRGTLSSSAHLTVTPVTLRLVDEIVRVATDAADEVRGRPAPTPPPGFVDVIGALESGALSPGDIAALDEDEVHALVAGVLGDGDVDPGGKPGGEGRDTSMAPLMAAIERLPEDVGARLVRAYLAAVME